MIQEAHHLAEIKEEDLTLTWRYTGFCRAETENAIEFSIDTDTNTPFEALDCYAYDLRRDPGQLHKIRPLLIGPDGISKKIAVPFLEPLSGQQPFSVLLKCALPGCMKAGLEYYTSTLSFAQDRVRRSVVRLAFVGQPPVWVRVYECTASGAVRLVKDLRPVAENQKSTEYEDLGDQMQAQSGRIYVFWRSTPLLVKSPGDCQ